MGDNYSRRHHSPLQRPRHRGERKATSPASATVDRCCPHHRRAHLALPSPSTITTTITTATNPHQTVNSLLFSSSTTIYLSKTQENLKVSFNRQIFTYSSQHNEKLISKICLTFQVMLLQEYIVVIRIGTVIQKFSHSTKVRNTDIGNSVSVWSGLY